MRRRSSTAGASTSSGLVCVPVAATTQPWLRGLFGVTSSVAENTPQGTDVGDLGSTDPDSAQTHTYTLVAGAGSTVRIRGYDLTTVTAVALPSELAEPLRAGQPAVVGHVERGRLLLDLIAVPAGADAAVVEAVRRAAKTTQG